MDKSLRQEIIEWIHLSHDSLQDALEGEKGCFVPWLWLELNLVPLAKKIYQSNPHWHLWNGKCIESIPFEIRIACTGLFCQVWFYDIMLRKARDRNLPNSRMGIEEWRANTDELLDAVRNLVDSARDLEAERRHRETAKPVNKIKHWINTLLWGH